MKKRSIVRLMRLLLIALGISLLSSCARTPLLLYEINLITPINQAQNQPLFVTMQWELPADMLLTIDSRGTFIEYYRVFLAMANNWYREPIVVWVSDLEKGYVEYETGQLAEKTDYKWRVEAVKNDGTVTSSEERQFKTGAGGMQTLPFSMTPVGGGTFQMGDNDGGEPWTTTWFGGYPVHPVTLNYDFMIGNYEITFNQFDEFCNDTGRTKPNDDLWGYGRGNRPVYNVSWWYALAFCNWLSEQANLSPAYNSSGILLDGDGNITKDITKVKGYRLPTEAEWEYAARGGHLGTVPSFLYAGSNDYWSVAWFWSNAECVKFIGQKAPNELGLYDMSGNITEWCFDWWDRDYYAIPNQVNPIGPDTGEYRAIRGGSIADAYYKCRSGRRAGWTAGSYAHNIGFRIVRTMIPYEW